MATQQLNTAKNTLWQKMMLLNRGLFLCTLNVLRIALNKGSDNKYKKTEKSGTAG
jgi:hypothetical protein